MQASPALLEIGSNFLDYCYNDGKKPHLRGHVFLYARGQYCGGGTGLQDYIRDYDKLVKSTIKHPAVFGYMVGNEIFGGVTQNPQFWQNFGNLIHAASGRGAYPGSEALLDHCG